MCGISGFITFKQTYNRDQLLNICTKMTDTLVHRGPDSSGIWCDPQSGISVGHRRLSIVDLSKSGHQPMISHNDRYVIVFNGEIYNHISLRKELQSKGYSFKGTSDTEVAVCAIQEWGIKNALEKFVGMFAFGVWDKNSRNLYLARDRVGEKPLYYGKFGNTIAFASELKALRMHPDWVGDINRDAITQLLKYTYIPSPWSIYYGINKLIPGTYVEISGSDSSRDMVTKTYWSLENVAIGNIDSRHKRQDPDYVIQNLDELLSSTIQDKMVADVPLGAFLSGGIDSSLVVSLMQKHSPRPVKSFSIGFNEAEFNEAGHAKKIAEYLGTDHTELYVTPEDSISVIPKIPEIYDEPFSDSSQIPTYLVSQLARRDVTVALSGDGGDELFGGYSRYMIGLDTWSRINRVPRSIRKVGGSIVQSIPTEYLDQIIKPARMFLPKQFRFKQFGQKIHKLAKIWNTSNPDAIYNSLISLWPEPEKIVIGSRQLNMLDRHAQALARLDNFTERMMYTDTLSYLPDDILAKVDRASMAVSLEVRVPFLDHRIIEYIWKQSPDLKIVGNEGKWLLKQVLYKYIPKNLVDRPKMGFGVPIDQWLRGPLKEWADELLSEDRLNSEGYFNAEPILEKWREHRSGYASWHYHLWPVLMFQAWHQHWMK